ncbi:MAG: FadR/GntR family transcriptional regulator [Thermomicrobiales bacterium]
MSLQEETVDASLFTSVRRARLWSSAVEQIRALIDDGRLPIGTRLPGERELCQQLGISRVSLREAIRVLESTGHLEVRPGRGTFVRDPSEPARGPLAAWLRDHNDHIRKLFELRELVEPGLAALAARRGDRATDEALQETVDEMATSAARGDLIRVVAADAEFHHILAHSTGNSIVDGLMRQLIHVIGEERRASLLIPGQVERAMAGHSAILDAVARRDPAAAAEAMRRHLEDALFYIDQWLAAQEARGEGAASPWSGRPRQSSGPGYRAKRAKEEMP